jgi:hypothetical protein
MTVKEPEARTGYTILLDALKYLRAAGVAKWGVSRSRWPDDEYEPIQLLDNLLDLYSWLR